jgi:hypothetical protein
LSLAVATWISPKPTLEKETKTMTQKDLPTAMAAIGEAAQKMCDTLASSFKKAALDPNEAARLRELASKLKAIKDRIVS